MFFPLINLIVLFKPIKLDIFISRIIRFPSHFFVPVEIFFLFSVTFVHNEFLVFKVILFLFHELGFELGPSVVFAFDIYHILVTSRFLLFRLRRIRLPLLLYHGQIPRMASTFNFKLMSAVIWGILWKILVKNIVDALVCRPRDKRLLLPTEHLARPLSIFFQLFNPETFNFWQDELIELILRFRIHFFSSVLLFNTFFFVKGVEIVFFLRRWDT